MEKIQKYIADNWKLKALSVLLAIMLWLAVYFIGEMKKEITVPVSILNLGKDFVITNVDMKVVNITLHGRVSVLKEIKDSEVKAFVNLTGAKEGENVFSIAKSDIEMPKGVQIAQIKPSAVKVEIDRLIEKRLKTIVNLDRKWIGRYTIKSWAPLYVTVEGPKRAWGVKSSIETDPVDGDFRNDEEIATVTLNTEGLQSTKVKPDTVRVILRKQHGKETLWH